MGKKGSKRGGRKGYKKGEKKRESEDGGASSATSLLENLRKNPKFSDCVISAGGEDISVHRNIVSGLAPFFDRALTGDFKESKEKRIAIGDTTARAVHILLDHAYSVEYKEKVHSDTQLAFEVWELANRFEVHALANVCAKGFVKNISADNAVLVLRSAVSSGCDAEVIGKIELFIAQNFTTVFKNTDNADQIWLDDLRAVLRSRELIADECTRFTAVMNCCRNMKGTEKESEMIELLKEIRFELLTSDEMDRIIREFRSDFPTDVWVQICTMRMNGGPSYPSFEALDRVRRENEDDFLDGHDCSCFENNATERTIVYPVRVGDDGKSLKAADKMFFTFGVWVMSAVGQVAKNGRLEYQLKCERRSSATKPSQTLRESMKGLTLTLSFLLVPEKGKLRENSAERNFSFQNSHSISTKHSLANICNLDNAGKITEFSSLISLSVTKKGGSSNRDTCFHFMEDFEFADVHDDYGEVVDVAVEDDMDFDSDGVTFVRTLSLII